MKTVYVLIGENKIAKNISCWGVAATRELAEKLAKKCGWGMDRFNINECEMFENENEIQEESK